MSITAQTEKVKTCIYLPHVLSDNSRLHKGVSQVGEIRWNFLMVVSGSKIFQSHFLEK